MLLLGVQQPAPELVLQRVERRLPVVAGGLQHHQLDSNFIADAASPAWPPASPSGSWPSPPASGATAPPGQPITDRHLNIAAPSGSPHGAQVARRPSRRLPPAAQRGSAPPVK